MKILGCVLVITLVMAQSSICFATLLIDAEWVTVDMENQEVSFTLVFSGIPDFYTADEHGRQANAFQYYIDFDCSPVYYGGDFVETIIRGGEIHVYGQIPLRNSWGESSDPTAGGWGEIRALVPYELNGRQLTFTASLEAIGDLDGRFSYALGLFEYGGSTDWRYVPEPASVLLLGIGGLALVRKRTK